MSERTRIFSAKDRQLFQALVDKATLIPELEIRDISLEKLLVTFVFTSFFSERQFDELLNIFNPKLIQELQEKLDISYEELITPVYFDDEFRDFLRAFTENNRLGTSILRGIPLEIDSAGKKSINSAILMLLFADSNYKEFVQAVFKYVREHKGSIQFSGYNLGKFSERSYNKLKLAIPAFKAQKSDIEEK